MRKCIILLLILSLTAGAIEIKLAQAAKVASSREVFWTDVLHFVLDHSKVPYTIDVTYQMAQSRIIRELETNSGRINLHVMGTSAELEKKLLPIRIPVTRGLVGYRVFIIHKDKQVLFDSTTTLDSLQKLLGLQGLGWSDIAILEHSGLRQKEMDYNRIFNVINIGRGDYFSRSLHETFEEVAFHEKQLPNLRVEKNILLVYPFALFAFTSHQNTELAKVLEKAFMKAYDDGVFVPFFYNHPHIKNALEKADIEKRVIINIPNPTLTDETAAIPQQYWHDE